MTPTIDYGDSLRLGIIIPSGNVVAEPQIRAMVPPGVSALFTRLALRGSSDAELQRMTEGVEEAATLLADARVGRVIFHCTAVTTPHRRLVPPFVNASSPPPAHLRWLPPTPSSRPSVPSRRAESFS